MPFDLQPRFNRGTWEIYIDPPGEWRLLSAWDPALDQTLQGFNEVRVDPADGIPIEFRDALTGEWHPSESVMRVADNLDLSDMFNPPDFGPGYTGKWILPQYIPADHAAETPAKTEPGQWVPHYIGEDGADQPYVPRSLEALATQLYQQGDIEGFNRLMAIINPERVDSPQQPGSLQALAAQLYQQGDMDGFNSLLERMFPEQQPQSLEQLAVQKFIEGDEEGAARVWAFRNQPTQLEKLKAALEIARSPGDLLTLMRMYRQQGGTIPAGPLPPSPAFAALGIGQGQGVAQTPQGTLEQQEAFTGPESAATTPPPTALLPPFTAPPLPPAPLPPFAGGNIEDLPPDIREGGGFGGQSDRGTGETFEDWLDRQRRETAPPAPLPPFAGGNIEDLPPDIREGGGFGGQSDRGTGETFEDWLDRQRRETAPTGAPFQASTRANRTPFQQNGSQAQSVSFGQVQPRRQLVAQDQSRPVLNTAASGAPFGGAQSSSNAWMQLLQPGVRGFAPFQTNRFTGVADGISDPPFLQSLRGNRPLSAPRADVFPSVLGYPFPSQQTYRNLSQTERSTLRADVERHGIPFGDYESERQRQTGPSGRGNVRARVKPRQVESTLI